MHCHLYVYHLVRESDNPVYATHEDAKQAFKELLREKVNEIHTVHVYGN